MTHRTREKRVVEGSIAYAGVQLLVTTDCLRAGLGEPPAATEVGQVGDQIHDGRVELRALGARRRRWDVAGQGSAALATPTTPDNRASISRRMISRDSGVRVAWPEI